MIAFRSFLASGWHRLGIGIALGLLLFSSSAQAGPVEQLVDLVVGPGDSPVLIARYVNTGGGLIFSPDRGRSWQLQCNSAFLDAAATANSALLVLDNGTVLVPNSHGLSSMDLRGCDWHAEFSDPKTSVSDLNADPTEPNVAIGLVGAVVGGAIRPHLARRGAAGIWAEFGKSDELVPISLRATLHDGQLRLYEIAQRLLDDGAADDAGVIAYSYVLRVSDDRAQSWRESTLSADGTPTLLGVDPKNPDRIALLISRFRGTDRVLISADRGANFSPYLELGEFGGFTFAPDGRVWIGDLGNADIPSAPQGLWAAQNLDTAATHLPMADYAVQCLAYRPSSNTLYACQRFWAGEVNPQSGEFTKQLSLATVNSFVSCDGFDPVGSCKRQLCGGFCGAAHFASAPVCAAYDEPGCGVPVAREEAGSSEAAPVAAGSGAAGKGTGSATTSAVAGTRAAVGGEAAPAPKELSSGCACTVAASRKAPGFGLWLWLSSGLLLGWQRRRVAKRRAIRPPLFATRH